MVRKFQLQPLWQPGLAVIELPNQPVTELDNPSTTLGLEFFSTWTNLPPTFVTSDVPKLRAQVRYVIPFDAIRNGTPNPIVDSSYRLELNNIGTTTIYISPSQERAGGLQAPIAVGPGQSASIVAGSTISWSLISCSTILVLSPDIPAIAPSIEDHGGRVTLHATFPPSIPSFPQAMDVDPNARSYVQGFSSRQAPAAPVPILQFDSKLPNAVERKPLKEPFGISLPLDAVSRGIPESASAKVKSESTSPRGVGSPRSAFRENTPLKTRMPQNLSDLAPSISPRNSTVINPTIPSMQLSPRHSMNSTTGDPAFISAALRDIQSRHAGEMEALLMNQQLEIVNLVTRQKLEVDSFMRGVPMLGPSQTVNLGVLGVFNTLNKIQTMLQQRELTGSGEIDILSLDEQSQDNGSWKTTAGGHGAAPSGTRGPKKGRPRKETHSHSSSPAAASPAPGGPSPASSHNHHHHHHHQNITAHHRASESGSEEEGLRRAQRKRKTPSQPDYFVDDREMEQILGGKKRRAEVTGNTADPFPVPVAVAAPSPASTPVPFKKPKPRDNVSIATILDIYSPLKSTLGPWKFVTGDKTLILFHTDCLDHITPEWHLESPNRLKAVMDSIALVQERYSDFCEVVSDFSPADLDLVRQCHHDSYIKKIMNKIPINRAMPPLHATQDIELSLSMSSSLAKPSTTADPQCEPPKDTFVSFGSWNAALLAAGSVIVAIDRLFKEPMASQGHLRNAFCGVRPPGHHAGSHGHDGASTNGYCVLNSVAIGAQYAFHTYNLQRIAILDFDVHQGNGTAQIVEKDPRILFISLHGSEIYPFSETTKADADKCTDRVINIGYPTGTNGKQFMELFVNRCKQVLIDFNPELILLSAGFDAHIDDPTGAAMLRFADYVALTRVVKEIADTPSCKGRIISVLEGGYDIRALKLSVTAHILTLMEGSAAPRPQNPTEPSKVTHQVQQSNGNHSSIPSSSSSSSTPSSSSTTIQLNPSQIQNQIQNNKDQTPTNTVPSSTTSTTASSNAMAVDVKSEENLSPTPSEATTSSVPPS